MPVESTHAFRVVYGFFVALAAAGIRLRSVDSFDEIYDGTLAVPEVMQRSVVTPLVRELQDDLAGDGRIFSGAMKTIRINLSALTRQEFSAEVEVPEEFTHEDCLALVRMADDSVDGDQYREDVEYWERGDSYYQMVTQSRR